MDKTTFMQDPNSNDAFYAEVYANLASDEPPFDLPEPAYAEPVEKRLPRATSSRGIQARHISTFKDRMIGKLKLAVEFGDEACGGEMLGFRELDEELNIEAGRLIVLAAREGVGKSALALQIARTIAMRINPVTNKGGEVLFLITEMDAEDAVTRVLAQFAQLEARKFRRGVTTDIVVATERAFAFLAESGLHIADVSGFNVNEIVSFVHDFHRRHEDLRAVFIDNLTGVAPAAVRRSQGSHEYVGEIMEKLNNLSKRDAGVGTPVFVLAHLARPERGRETKRPFATDLAGSDKINRWADTIMLLHRVVDTQDNPHQFGSSSPWVEPKGEGFHKTHEMLVEKNRDGRDKFIIDLEFVGSQLRFVAPEERSIRPYDIPEPESAARTEYRRRILELDFLL